VILDEYEMRDPRIDICHLLAPQSRLYGQPVVGKIGRRS